MAGTLARRRPHGWLTLDAADDEPARFLNYLPGH
jgi:ATP/maltotriose-dependent transcriptional regulator MalT